MHIQDPTTTEAENEAPDPSTDPEPAVYPEDPSAEVRLYTTIGGDIVVAFSEQAELVSADPNEGFTLESSRGDNGELIVDLRDGEIHSQLIAWLDGGPQVLLDDH